MCDGNMLLLTVEVLGQSRLSRPKITCKKQNGQGMNAKTT